jgi:hypothetical protein
MAVPDDRQAARDRIDQLIALLKQHPTAETAALVEECEALARAIAAFHMEGIRFRMFNVSRLLTRTEAALPEASTAILEEARHHLEAAGFHTRSHQAPS